MSEDCEDRKVTRGKSCGKPPLRVSLIRGALLLGFSLFAKTLMAGECFCLEDEDDNFRHSCQTQRQGIRTVTHCRDAAGEPYTLDDLSGWTRLAAGKGRCNPCQPGKIRVTEGPIRGDDDPPPSEGTADDRPE